MMGKSLRPSVPSCLEKGLDGIGEGMVWGARQMRVPDFSHHLTAMGPEPQLP